MWNRIDSFAGNFTHPALAAFRPCPICGGVRSRVVTELSDFQFYSDSATLPKRLNVTNHQCLECFAVYMNPCYSSYGFEVLFAEAGESYGASEGRPEEEVAWMSARGLMAPGRRLLDAGCYDGRLLSFMPRHVARVGVDIDEPAIQRGRAKFGSQGVAFILGDFENFRCEPPPDTITMFHVLEHLPRPVRVLEHLRADSHPETRVVIEVPILDNGFTNDICGFLSAMHMTHFSRQSLRNALAAAGWSVCEWYEHPDYNGCRILARPETNRTPPRPDAGDASLVHRYLSHWHGMVAKTDAKLEVLRSSRSCVVWGGGLHTEFLYQACQLFHDKSERRFAIVDSDERKQGLSWRGIAIQKPEAIREIDWTDCHLVISTYGSQETVAKAALQLGVPADRILKLYDEIRIH